MKINYFLSLILLISIIVMVNTGYFSWKKGKKYVSVTLLPVAIYAFGYAFEILCSHISEVKFWTRIEYLGISFLPVAWIMFVLNFTLYKERIKKSKMALFYVIPFITLILNYTSDFHHFYYADFYMHYNGFFKVVKVVPGPWYWVNEIYTYGMVAAGIILLMTAYFKEVSIIKKQIIFIIAAWAIPWLGDIVSILKLLPLDVDLCPLGFSLASIITSYAILRLKLLKLTPIALEKVFSSMVDGVIILDYENNIINFNNSAQKIIKELNYIVPCEKKIDEALSNYDSILSAVSSASDSEKIIKIGEKEQLRHYKVNVNNIYESNGNSIGKTIIFNDITEFELQREKLSDDLNFIETLINAIPSPIYSKDERGAYNHCNTAFTDFLGLKKENVIGHTVFEVFESEIAKSYYKADMNLLKQGGIHIYESKLMHVDGTYHDVVFNKSVFINERGNYKGLVCIIVDITETKKDREKINKLLTLKEAMLNIGYNINEISEINDLLQLILDKVISCLHPGSCGSILLIDEEQNLKIAAAKGYDADDIGKFKMRLKDTGLTYGEQPRVTVFNDIDENSIHNAVSTEEGMKIKSSISSPIIIDGKLYGLLNIDSIYNNIFDETDLELMEYMRNQIAFAISKHRLYEQTIYLSRYDKLTNVYNRSYFEQLFQNNISKDILNGSEFLVAVFDLNGLKAVNDNFGHLVGDELIKTFSKGLSSLAEKSDIIGRFGGDEFVGVFYNLDIQSLSSKFEELAERFKNNPMIFGENKIICSYSYGIVHFPSDGTEIRQLIKIADERMYKYKGMVKQKYECLKRNDF